MGFFSFFSSSKPARQAPGRKRSHQLELEPLEDRCVPTSTSQSITFVSQQTGGISSPALFNQFNPNLGTLQSITIAQTGSISSDIKVENMSTLSGATITATVAGSMELTGGGLTQDITLNPITETYNAAVYDGTLDFSSPSGTDFGYQTASGNNSTTLTGSQMSPFEGTGTVALNESSTAGSNATSNVGNLALEIASTATADVTVTYNYIPNNASIAGIVYVDANDSGSYNSNDSGIAGVTLTLTGTTTGGTPVSQTTTTSATGAYSFTNLAPGTYSVAETPPSGYFNAQDNLGSLGASNGSVSPNDLSSITISSGQAGTNYNFGHLLPSSIAGIVYVDNNDSGVDAPGDPGISGVTVTLTGTNDLGASVSQTATTSSTGAYSFTNLRPGTYTLTETPPADYLNAKDNLGSLGASDGTVGTNVLSSVVIGEGVAGTNYNFGHLQPASLSGFAYVDANKDGKMDPGDPGIGGVTITLTGTSDQGPVIMTTTTASNGSYSFSNLRPGTYTITQSPPAGYLPGTDNLGSLGGTVGSNQFTSVVVASDNQGTLYNFGEITPTDDLAIVKTASASSVPVGSQLTYTLTVSNDGAATAQGVSVSDPLPAGETYVSSAGTGWTITDTNGTVTATEPSLAVGASSSFTITVTAPNTPGSVTNTGTVTSTTPDSNPNNNQSSVTTLITDTDDLAIVKTASASSVSVGSQLTYTLTVSNDGSSTAQGVSVSDPLPAGESYVSSAGTGWTITNTNGTITATEPSLAVGASSSFTITVTVPNTPGSVTNTGTVTSTTPDSNPNNNQSSVTTLITGTDDVSIVKTASASSVVVGSQLTYTLAVSNNGPMAAQGVSVSDPLPAGETYISALGPGWTITDTNNTVTATTATLPVGVTSTFTITVQMPDAAGSVTNTATVTSVTPDSDPNNNQSSVTTLITGLPTGTQQGLQVQFGAAPVFTKTQLVGGSLNTTLTQLADWVESMYLTLTGSAPSATTVSSDVFKLETGSLTQQQLVSQLYFSGQFIDQEINNIYESIMGTAPTASQLSSAASQLQSGVSLTTLESNLLTSAAYLQTHASPDALVAGLDQSILGSTPTVSSLQLQVQSLGATTWNAYVQSQVTSTQALTQIIDTDYQGILGRAPSAAELSSWITAIQNGQATPDTIAQQLFASSEFLQLAYQNA